MTITRCSTCGNQLDYCQCVDALFATLDPKAISEAAHESGDPAVMTADVDDRTGMVHDPENCGGAVTEQRSRWCARHREWHGEAYCTGCLAWVDYDNVGVWESITKIEPDPDA